MKLTLTSFLLLASCTTLVAQNIIQDTKGQTSLSLNAGANKATEDSTKKETVDFALGLIKFSSSEKKLELNYYQYFRPNNAHPFFWGVSAAGEVKNSLSSLFSSGDIAPGTEIKLRFGKRLAKRKMNEDYDVWEKHIKDQNGGSGPTQDEIEAFLDSQRPASDLWFVANGAFTGSKIKLFHPDSTFEKQIEKVNFSALEANIGFNFWSAKLLRSTFLIGATIGIKGKNNFDDLSESVQKDITTRVNANENTTREIIEKQTVFKGKYTESTLYPLNIDVYFKPHQLQNVAFLLFSRTDYSFSHQPRSKAGFGVYFLRGNNLFNPVAGINIDYKDVFDTDASDDDKPGKSKLNIGIVTNLSTLLFQKRS